MSDPEHNPASGCHSLARIEANYQTSEAQSVQLPVRIEEARESCIIFRNQLILIHGPSEPWGSSKGRKGNVTPNLERRKRSEGEGV